MEPHLLFPTSSSGASFSGVNQVANGEPAGHATGEGFDCLIQSALEKKSLQPDGESVDPFLAAMIGYFVSPLLNSDPNVLGETVAGSQNPVLPGSIPLSPFEAVSQLGVQKPNGPPVTAPEDFPLEIDSDSAVTDLFSPRKTDNGAPWRETPGQELLNVKEGLAVDSKGGLLEAGADSLESGSDSTRVVSIDGRILDKALLSAQLGIETDIPGQNLPIAKGGVAPDSKEGLLKAGAGSPWPVSDSTEAVSVDRPIVDKTLLSAQLGIETDIPGQNLLIAKGGVAPESKEGLLRAGAGSPGSVSDSTEAASVDRPIVGKGSLSIQAGTERETAGQDVLKVKGGLVVDSKEDSTGIGLPGSSVADKRGPSTQPGAERVITGHGLQDHRESLVEAPTGQKIELSQTSRGTEGKKGIDSLLRNGGPDSIEGIASPFVREEWPGSRTISREMTEIAAKGETSIKEDPIPSSAQGRNGEGLGSLSSPRPVSQSFSNFTSHETERGSLPPPMGTNPAEVFEQVGKQILWSLKNREEKIKMVLEPPELGNIYMEVKREKDLVNATLWTDNAAAKELLESHQVQLQKALKADGFALDKFDVFVQPEMAWLGHRDRSADPGPWFQTETQDEGTSGGPASPEVGSLGSDLSIRSSRYVDLFV